MTLKEIENELRTRFENDDKRKTALNRFLQAAQAPETFDSIEAELPPKARYVGPGPWLDAIKNSFEKK